MEVSVMSCSPLEDPFCENTTPIAGTKIYLYETEEERQFNATPLFEGTTNSSGKYMFSQLDGGARYYLRVACPNELHETSESTPSNGIAYHEILCAE